MATTDPVTPEPRRFSLRPPRPLWIGVATVVLVVTAVGLQFGVPAYRQGVALRNIERLGGHVIAFEVGPDWLRSWIGDDRMKIFDVVDSVRFTDGVQATDEALAQLDTFTRLRELDIGDTPDAPITAAGIARAGRLNSLVALYLRDTALDDAGLAALPELPNLKRLYLANTAVTDAGLANLVQHRSLEALELDSDFSDRGLGHVAQLHNLRRLVVRSPSITDDGLVRLAPLTHLETLRITATRITSATTERLAPLPGLHEIELDGATDDALAPLGQCVGLTSLWLAGSDVTDVGIAHVSVISSLRHLSLKRTRVTDAGLSNLSRLTNLSNLTLVGEPFTDAGVEHLKQLENLRTLFLGGTQVTDAALEELKTLRTGLHVINSRGGVK